MKFLISRIHGHARAESIGFITADSLDDALEKLGLNSSRMSPNGFWVSSGRGSLDEIHLNEISDYQISNQSELVIALERPKRPPL